MILRLLVCDLGAMQCSKFLTRLLLLYIICVQQLFDDSTAAAAQPDNENFCRDHDDNNRAFRGISFSKKKIPIIVDTDMDIDDMMALIVLLNNPMIEIRGIVVDSSGWSVRLLLRPILLH